MKVYLIRHSNAVSEGPGLIDPHRYLSDQGRARARAVGAKLKAIGVSLEAVVHSPLVRAVQTAEIVIAELGLEAVPTATPELEPGAHPSRVAGRLPALGVSSVALVGHEPTISALGAFLLNRPSFPPFRPCQVSLIEDGRPQWTLVPDRVELEQLIV